MWPIEFLNEIVIISDVSAYGTNYERGISAAFSRSKSQFFWTTRRLLIGPGAIMTAGLIISILAAIMIDGNGNLLGPAY